MKMKRLIPFFLAVILVLGLTACGAKTSSPVVPGYNGSAAYDSDFGVSMEEAAPSATISNSGNTAESKVETDRKLIKRVYMDVETEDLDETLAKLNSRINTVGGYIESQEQYNGSSYSSYRSRSATMVIRVPAENLEEFIGEVEGISNVTTFRQSQDDVTLSYVATESRMNALKAEEERLLELMSQAETMYDLLEVEDRLTDVRYELESVTSQLRVLSNQVSYATVNLDIDQVTVYTPTAKQTVWERIGSGFKENLGDIAEDLEDFFVWFVVYIPQLVIFAVIVFVIVVVSKRSAKKKREKRLEQQRAYLQAQQNMQQQNPNNNPPKA